MSRSYFRPVIAGVALAVSSALMSTGALAQAPADAAPAKPSAAQAERGGKHAKHAKHGDPRQRAMFQAMREGLLVPGLGPVPKQVVDTLNLNEAQQKQLAQTRASQRELGKSLREAGKSRHETLQAQLSAGKLDPRALVAENQGKREQLADERKAVQDRWLALWDSLDATQQAKVADYVKQRHERMAQRAEARKAKAAG
ncbi:hypothetical protein V8Z80_00705 [Orrella sp. JC864]|uniref:hypothetical protein n=1 Tax=Orrella sp. JC864 TaxID=3120298 RepID=UPI00300B4808